MRVKIIYDGKYMYEILDSDTLTDVHIINHIKQSEKIVRGIEVLDDFKICKICGEKVDKKEISKKFYLAKSGIDGYRSICKKCVTIERILNNILKN